MEKASSESNLVAALNTETYGKSLEIIERQNTRRAPHGIEEDDIRLRN